jgi:hypothetical protein
MVRMARMGSVVPVAIPVMTVKMVRTARRVIPALLAPRVRPDRLAQRVPLALRDLREAAV